MLKKKHKHVVHHYKNGGLYGRVQVMYWVDSDLKKIHQWDYMAYKKHPAIVPDWRYLWNYWLPF